MRIKIAARKSDLSRMQARSVGRALSLAHKDIEIEYIFKSSLGDQNQNDPLWKMPERGVFTEDFHGSLVSGEYDLVVHSWKDLPVEQRAPTEIFATLKRADQRDLLLFRKDLLERAKASGQVKVFTSSPRRAYNLNEFLPRALPFEVEQIEFVPVRGNVQTRVRKLLEGDVEALVVAKAALDRMLAVSEEEFFVTRDFLRQALDQVRFMVLPLSQNPTAAAQGALAIELRSDRNDLKELVSVINVSHDFQVVEQERKLLKKYGGGCHQKIGISILRRDYGHVTFEKGQIDQLGDFHSIELKKQVPWSQPQEGEYFPEEAKGSTFFNRQPVAIDKSLLDDKDGLWIARANATEGLTLPENKLVWAAGVTSWQKLAEKGLWVHGCADGLGEKENPQLEILLGGAPQFLRLTHSDALDSGPYEALPTYELVEKDKMPDLKGKTHFYWMSASSFKTALKHHPDIAQGYHACGPGKTFDVLSQHIADKERLQIFISYEEWKKWVTHE